MLGGRSDRCKGVADRIATISTRQVADSIAWGAGGFPAGAPSRGAWDPLRGSDSLMKSSGPGHLWMPACQRVGCGVTPGGRREPSIGHRVQPRIPGPPSPAFGGRSMSIPSPSTLRAPMSAAARALWLAAVLGVGCTGAVTGGVNGAGGAGGSGSDRRDAAVRDTRGSTGGTSGASGGSAGSATEHRRFGGIGRRGIGRGRHGHRRHRWLGRRQRRGGGRQRRGGQRGAAGHGRQRRGRSGRGRRLAQRRAGRSVGARRDPGPGRGGAGDVREDRRGRRPRSRPRCGTPRSSRGGRWSCGCTSAAGWASPRGCAGCWTLQYGGARRQAVRGRQDDRRALATPSGWRPPSTS